MLTIGAVKAAAAQPRAYKMFDAGGLFLHVAPTGAKSWRLKYRHAGKEKLLTIGRFPEVSLPEARARREDAKASLREGRDPGQRSGVLGGNTFEHIARAWHALHRPHWSPAHAVDVITSFERDVFPAIGAMPIGTIAAPDVLAAVRAVELRGRGQTARRIRQRCAAVFGYAMSEGLAKENPAATIAAALLPPKLTKPHPALTDIDACRALLDACEALPDAYFHAKVASHFLALTAVRLDAVRGMRWGEIEDWDGAPVWRVPPARMKLARAKKESDRFAHLVPLSSPAVELLQLVAAKNGYDTHSAPAGGLVFPGRGKTGPLGERAIGELYVRAGFSGRHVPHGWRASFSTILNEQLPLERAAIDLALAHAPKDKVEAAYNRSEQLDRRRRLFDLWGELLTG